MFAVDNFLEAADRVGQLDILAWKTGKRLRHVKRLREEPLNLACPRHDQLVVVAQFVDAQNGDNVLQVLVPLQNAFYRLGSVVVIVADDQRIENTRSRRQRIDGGIDPQLGDRARQVGGRIEVRKRRRGRGI